MSLTWQVTMSYICKTPEVLSSGVMYVINLIFAAIQVCNTSFLLYYKLYELSS